MGLRDASASKNLHRKEDAKVQIIIIKFRNMATFPIDFLQEQAKKALGGRF